MPPISVLIKPASGNCNMNCTYCFYRDEQENRKQRSYGMMSEETLKNVIRKAVLHAEGSCILAFQGGEPSLVGLDFFKKVVEYVKYYNRKNIMVQYAFQTNGTNLTKEWCEFFHENHFLVGVSVDGTKEIHDKCRRFNSGEPTYDKVMEGCRLLDKYKVEYNILTVVHKEVAQNIRLIYEDLKRKKKFYQQYIACLDPLFTEKGNMPYSLTPELYGNFLTELFDLWYADYKKGRQPYNRLFENYIGILMGYVPEACEQRGICSVQYVVEADGSVYPCDFYMLDEYCIGNFNDTSIAQMDKKREEIRFREISMQISKECRECKYLALCRNGCRRNRIPDGPEEYRNYFCESYRMFFDKCLPRMQEIAETLRKNRF